MPGISPQDTRSELSESSARSSDSRAQGKKVSFNRAVRVKQYPWQPDEPPELEERHDRRFWFKVYKNSANPVPQSNNWRHSDKPEWNETDGENAHDSLTPIAEDEDVEGTNFSEIGYNHGSNVENGNHFDSRPLDPPVDYNDDYNLFSRTGRYSLRRPDQWKSEMKMSAQRYGENSTITGGPRNDHHKTKVTNGFLSPLRNPDFRRPTIASAAKSTDKPLKQPIINIRLPRPVAKDTSFDKRKNGSLFSSSQRFRERRSKSNDDHERYRERASRIDKAVSTEDLSTGSMSIGVNGSKIDTYSTLKKNKDKATQCTGTLTNYRKNGENLRGVLKSKPTFSTIFAQSENKDVSLNRQDFNKNGQLNSNDMDSKQLLLHGKSCFTNNGYNETKRVAEPKVLQKGNSHYNNGNVVKLNSYNDRFEYDYVTDAQTIVNNKSVDFKTQLSQENASITNGGKNVEKHKRASWKTMVDNNIDVNSIICRDDEEMEDFGLYSQTTDKRSSSTIGHVQGKQVPISSKKRHMSSDGITRTGLGNDIQYKSYLNDAEPKYTMLKDHGSSKNSNRLDILDTDSPIDWSNSGFRLGARSAINLSSNSDSEFVVHRRPPLLMYIPGVSHHDRPAIEDDRLSARNGFSRSEGEDDTSPLSVDAKNVFSRRYSMPRNGKLNFLKWKSS